ncbi:MAG: helix-turn-helix domain-containing protein [Kosmotogaceae bacterium]
MPKKLTSEEEHWRRKLYDRGLNDKEIAMRVGLTASAIGAWRRRQGLPSHGKGQGLDDKEEKRRRELYDQGLSDREIARELDVSYAAIAQWRISRNLSVNKKKSFLDTRSENAYNKFHLSETPFPVPNTIGATDIGYFCSIFDSGTMSNLYVVNMFFSLYQTRKKFEKVLTTDENIQIKIDMILEPFPLCYVCHSEDGCNKTCPYYYRCKTRFKNCEFLGLGDLHVFVFEDILFCRYMESVLAWIIDYGNGYTSANEAL